MKKKLLSLALTVALSAGLLPQAISAASFTDVTSAYSWAKDAIETLSDAGIIQGYPDNTFKPGNNVSKQEAVVLCARMMGFSDESNDVVAAFAEEAYADSFTKLTTYAAGEMSYLIYKQILSTADIATYLNSSVMDSPAKRYEAAVLVAKCLGADAWLKDNPDIDVTFTDKADIPEAALPYVQYANDLGIITGMENNTFAPNESLTRAQIATMIQRMRDLMEFEYLGGVISAVDSELSTITLKRSDGSTQSYNVIKGVSVLVDGEVSPMNLIETGMSAVVTLSKGSLWSIDALQMVADGDISGVYVGSKKETSATIITIRDVDGGSSTNQQYTLASDVVFEHGGSKATLTDFTQGDSVTLTIKNDKVVKLSGKAKSETISSCVLEEIIIDPTFQLRVRTSDNDEQTYEVDSSATIRRNAVSSTFDKLAVGDKLNLTLEYDRVTYVDATGSSKTLEGSITEITISKTPTITITSDGESTKYSIDRSVTVTLDGTSATVYDLRLDYQVKVKISSDTVTEITVQSVTAPTSVTGQITLVNAAYNMIKINVVESNGEVTDTQVFLKSTAKILDSSTGQLKAMKDLKAGMSVMAAGAVNMGIFEATSVMIIDSNTAQ